MATIFLEPPSSYNRLETSIFTYNEKKKRFLFWLWKPELENICRGKLEKKMHQSGIPLDGCCVSLLDLLLKILANGRSAVA